MHIFAQIIGLFGVGVNLLIYQQKSQQKVLFFKFISDFLWAAHYFLLGAFSGAAIACIGVFREGVFIFSKKHRKKWLILFMIIALGSVCLTWKNLFSLFPAIASLLSVISFWQRNAKNTRLLALPIALCMGIYSFSSGSWSGVFNELLTISSAVIGLLRKEINNKMKKEIRIGVINWDCAAPKDTFFGYHTAKSLSPSEFRTQTPYYAHIDGPNQIHYTYKTQAEYDRELEYAIEAGIDYFAYTWYTEEKLNRDDIEGKLHEITHARKLHLSSKLKDRINLCAVFVCSHIHTDNDFEKFAAEMKQPYYEKIDGRPLIYLLGGYRTDYIDRLNALCKNHNLPAPYIVFFNSSAEAENEGGDFSRASAVSRYSCVVKGVTNCKEFYDDLIFQNERRKKFGIDIIPLFSMGWNPRPRILNPIPWTSYPDVDYAPKASKKELLEGARQLCDWIKENPKITQNHHILTFAWNEFEEGGWICPTYNEDLSINEERIEIFKEISTLFKENL